MTALSLVRWSDADQRAIRAQLVRITQSGPFLQSRRRQRFLEYVVNEVLAGRGERLKGYSVALEVFGRPESFDPIVDPIVRIEAARLREKLREYYEAAGRSDRVVIELPKGTYSPLIRFRRNGTADHRRQGGEAAVTDRLSFSAPEPGPKRRPSLAMLPFVNVGANREHDHIADGFTEALITDLAKVSGLFVVSRQSSFAYRHSNRPLPEIAAALRVRYLIEGSVHAENERVRVSINLVDTVSDHSLWAERYERSVRDIFAVQDEVCRSIVRALRLKLPRP